MDFTEVTDSGLFVKERKVKSTPKPGKSKSKTSSGNGFTEVLVSGVLFKSFLTGDEEEMQWFLSIEYIAS